MLIKREYVTFGTLLTDKETQKVVIDALKASDKKLSDEEIETILNCDSGVIFNQADLSSGIPDDAYQK